MWVFLWELSHGQKAYSPDDHTNCFILSQHNAREGINFVWY